MDRKWRVGYSVKDWCSVIVDSMVMKTCTSIQKQRCSKRYIETDVIVHPGFTSFLSINSSSSSFPHLCFSCSFSWEAKSLKASEFLLGFPGTQVWSGSVSICMEIGYSLGIRWGHTSTTAAHVRKYQGSAGGENVCVYKRLSAGSDKRVKQLANQFEVWFPHAYGNVLRYKLVTCRLCSLCHVFRPESNITSLCYISAFTIVTLLVC